jgi:hypothetical protein
VTGQTEALLVGGRAGVGKSSVGYEIHEQLSAVGGAASADGTAATADAPPSNMAAERMKPARLRERRI